MRVTGVSPVAISVPLAVPVSPIPVSLTLSVAVSITVTLSFAFSLVVDFFFGWLHVDVHDGGCRKRV